jgi:hypothetical protein
MNCAQPAEILDLLESGVLPGRNSIYQGEMTVTENADVFTFEASRTRASAWANLGLHCTEP